MECLVERKQNQKGMERFVLVLYSLYSAYLSIDCVHNGRSIWIPFFIFVLVIATWMMHILQWKPYQTRVMWMVSIIHLTVILYACNTQDLSVVVLTLIVMAVLAAFFEETGVVAITLASAVVIFGYHGLIKKNFGALTVEEINQFLFQIGNLVCVECVVYVWVKKRRALKKCMSQLMENLKEAEQSQDDFLANVSHEIRTPINTICGMSEIALREKNPEKLREEVVDIQDAGHNLTALVNDILDFSQMQSGNMELEEADYNITSTINDIIRMTMEKSQEKNLEVLVDCDAEIPQVLFGDEKKIRRVIMNLVDNAVKFTSEGCVDIHIGCRKESYGVNLMVTITDTGIGIREEEIEKLFLSFSQVDTKRNRQKGGMGLGLAISKALVKQMGGNIAVESTFGKGSSFRFVVPQKVVDENPIAKIDSQKKVHMAIYINMESFSTMNIGDRYSDNIRHMVEQLQVKCSVCPSLAELKQRDIRETFSHVFISLAEYREDSTYFDEMSERTKVVIVIHRQDEKYITNTKLLRLYKPLFILPVVSIINGGGKHQMVQRDRFIAPAAHVLVVDDNLMNIRVMEGLLKEYKIKVSKALSGMEALDMIESMDYDFIFMDHMMPEMDGIETFHRIRDKKGNYYKNIPVVALTANMVPGIREMFLKEGFLDFVSKPVEVSVLERVLKRILPAEKIIVQEEEVKADDSRQDVEKTELHGETDVELDMEKGMLYCGGEESYFEILSICCKDYAANVEELNGLLEARDWKNYTIKIHALKSNMNSIGALPLGNLTKELEMAGKKEDGAFIQSRHDGVMENYRQLIERLKKHPRVAFTETPVDAEPVDCYPELTDKAFDEMVSSMEEAMFEQDGKEMLRLLKTLQTYQYHQVPLASSLGAVQRKIEMEDYMSAVDMLADIQKKLAEKGGR